MVTGNAIRIVVADGAGEIGIEKKRCVIGENPAARLRLEGQDEAVEEGIDEERDEEQGRRQQQQRHAVEPEAASRDRSEGAADRIGGSLEAMALMPPPPGRRAPASGSAASATRAPIASGTPEEKCSSAPAGVRARPWNSRPRYSIASTGRRDGVRPRRARRRDRRDGWRPRRARRSISPRRLPRSSRRRSRPRPPHPRPA